VLRVVIACDHGGYDLKEIIKPALEELGAEVEDLGCPSTESVDFPTYAHDLSEAIVTGRAERGILICGTGIGMSMAANRHCGIRAALCGDVFSAKATRAHNDANVLCLGARVIGQGLALEIVKAFILGEYEGGRHDRRVSAIDSGCVS